MAFYFEFECPVVDFRNWVVDFGGLKNLKAFLEDQFDHTLLVAMDDPEYDKFMKLNEEGLAQVREVERTGCEGLSKSLYDYMNEIYLPENGWSHVHCRKVQVMETPANSAWYEDSWDNSMAKHHFTSKVESGEIECPPEAQKYLLEKGEPIAC
jgi:6-pyruvoyltetrahydropterin/6-carboxytetrahydropterin synthase